MSEQVHKSHHKSKSGTKARKKKARDHASRGITNTQQRNLKVSRSLWEPFGVHCWLSIVSLLTGSL